MKLRRVLFALLCCLVLLPACAGKAPESGKLKAVASAFPEYDLLRAVGGELTEVTLLLKPGMEAHSYEPTPQDILAIRGASLFVYGGGESDAWADRLLASGDLGSIRVLAFMDHALLREEETQEHMTAAEAQEAGEEYDEHVWTSPRNVILLTEALRDALAELDPAHAEDYRANAEAYIRKLEALDGELRTLAKTSVRDLLVVGGRFPFLFLVMGYGLS